MKKCEDTTLIPLCVPNLTGNEKRYLDNCIDTTYVSSVGDYVNRFEEKIAMVSGSAYAVATSSGTTGLHVALLAAGVKPMELVVVPTFTFIASANAVRHCFADPWLMDIKKENWCIDPEQVRQEIENQCKKEKKGVFHKATGKRVAAIMPVYTMGNIPNMNLFREIADDYKIPLVSDAACAIGAKYKDLDFGSLSDISVISFNGNKTVTCGGGGAVVGDEKEILHHIHHITTTARVWPDYDFDEVGYNYRMTNIQAAVGCAQMERLEEFVSTKRKVREYYQTSLKELTISKGISFFPTTEGSSCWMSGIVLPKEYALSTTKKICGRLKDEGIEAKPFWKPVHLQTPYMRCLKSDLSVSESLWQRIITLPSSTNISNEDMEYVVSRVKVVLGSI